MDGGHLGKSPESSFVLTALGAVHSRQGRLDEARGEFKRAIRMRQHLFSQSPWPTVDIQLRLAPALLDMGDRSGAAVVLAEARAVLVSFPEGAETLQARLNRLERRLAGALWGTRFAEPLTGREEAVLRLLGGTLSLREIGRELYLSGNTIKTHTRAIYRKLGVSSRCDAVQRARESGIGVATARRSDQVKLPRAANRVAAVRRIELAEDALEMRLDSVDRDVHFRSDVS
jgi:LuxR family maltose regulon positive regulatory protein